MQKIERCFEANRGFCLPLVAPDMRSGTLFDANRGSEIWRGATARANVFIERVADFARVKGRHGEALVAPFVARSPRSPACMHHRALDDPTRLVTTGTAGAGVKGGAPGRACRWPLRPYGGRMAPSAAAKRQPLAVAAAVTAAECQ